MKLARALSSLARLPALPPLRPLRPLLPLLPLLPLAVALNGCINVGPNYALPKQALVNAPLANGALEGADPTLTSTRNMPTVWWKLYDDPVLNGLVDEALKSNTDLRVAAANLARSREALGVAQAQGGFSGSASAVVERAQESAEQYLLTEKLPVVNEADLGINVSYEIDLFGKLRRGVEAASADTEAVEAAGDLARITVVADVVRSYVEQCSAAEELRIAQQSLTLQKERVDVSRRLRDAGRGNQTEVTRGQTQVENLAADIPRYTARRKIAQYQLAALLARAPSDLPPAVLACDRLPQISQPIPIGDGAALLRRRPDVHEAERQLAASTARIGVATAALYPSVSIGASTGFTGVLEDIGTSPTARWAFGPLISWDFPINGARQRVREAEASSQAALAKFDGVVLTALRETETNLATYASDYERAESLRAALKSAAQSADETHRLYLSGRESFISDLDATRTLTAAKSQLAAAEGQVAADQVNLFLSLGGGWEVGGQSTPGETPPQLKATPVAAKAAAATPATATSKTP
ncbi:efflux transporter outer membrane subunit [Paraburkholderia susongensis]|uniref:Efflux transporter, outer membrane factor (OMF) lipoprotein, NodT family n=1 Tax=Paraburkholderia susongensis TaxID=1515439 RepID=A0A1X7M5H1_9BURK|nr:efflux transporter outer membrane subunit [Paraburkholderia susongensis]SMG60773.1 efflux transporter, outer membrane factor (OMF) lipoprotein, NodT family [Paraburkholderia susongensis]